MKITFYKVRLKKRFPLAISRGVRSDSENLFIRYEKEGITGWGEAAPGKSEGAESVIKVNFENTSTVTTGNILINVNVNAMLCPLKNSF